MIITKYLTSAESGICRKFDKPDVKRYVDVSLADILTEDVTPKVPNVQRPNGRRLIKVDSSRPVREIIDEIREHLSAVLISYVSCLLDVGLTFCPIFSLQLLLSVHYGISSFNRRFREPS